MKIQAVNTDICITYYENSFNIEYLSKKLNHIFRTCTLEYLSMHEEYSLISLEIRILDQSNDSLVDLGQLFRLHSLFHRLSTMNLCLYENL